MQISEYDERHEEYPGDGTYNRTNKTSSSLVERVPIPIHVAYTLVVPVSEMSPQRVLPAEALPATSDQPSPIEEHWSDPRRMYDVPAGKDVFKRDAGAGNLGFEMRVYVALEICGVGTLGTLRLEAAVRTNR